VLGAGMRNEDACGKGHSLKRSRSDLSVQVAA